MREELDQQLAVIDAAFESGDLPALGDVVGDMRAPDVAEIIMALPRERRGILFNTLEPEPASETLAMLEEVVTRELLEDLDDSYIGALVDLMASDDAADVINLLPPERAQSVLKKISREEYEDVRELLKFDEESAGGLMAREVISVKGDTRIENVIELLRTEGENIEHIQYIYVVDNEEVLLGIIPIIRLLVVEPQARADEIMMKDVVTVTVDMDQEEVAAICAKYDLYSVPVVDSRGKLVGRITVDDILDVIEEEASEDIKIMAGTGDEEFWERSSLRVSRARLPWLLTGLFGGIASAAVMNHFRTSLETVIALAFFVPVIMAMGGNVGIQSSAIVVRELAIGGWGVVRTGGKLLRELKVSIINGIVLGSVLLAVVTIWQKDYRLGLLLALCMLTIICWATLMGAIVPLLLKKMNIDPALATGPFITTSNDILGILIYLGIATLFLEWIGGG